MEVIQIIFLAALVGLIAFICVRTHSVEKAAVHREPISARQKIWRKNYSKHSTRFLMELRHMGTLTPGALAVLDETLRQRGVDPAAALDRSQPLRKDEVTTLREMLLGPEMPEEMQARLSIAGDVPPEIYTEIDFNSAYERIEGTAKAIGMPDDVMLCYIVLIPIHTRYNDKSSFFYENDLAVLYLFAFIYSNIMLTQLVNLPCKERFKHGLKKIFRMFDIVFHCDSRREANKHLLVYDKALRAQEDILSIFIGMLERDCATDYQAFQKHIYLDTEINVFFVEILPTICSSVAKWCEMNEELMNF